MNQNAAYGLTTSLSVTLLPVAAVAASALTLTLFLAPELAPEVVLAVLAARLAISVARWLYIAFLGRKKLSTPWERLSVGAI